MGGTDVAHEHRIHSIFNIEHADPQHGKRESDTTQPLSRVVNSRLVVTRASIAVLTTTLFTLSSRGAACILTLAALRCFRSYCVSGTKRRETNATVEPPAASVQAGRSKLESARTTAYAADVAHEIIAQLAVHRCAGKRVWQIAKTCLDWR